MTPMATPAMTTVRGFKNTSTAVTTAPASTTDDDSESVNCPTPPLQPRTGKGYRILDDVVSANCSPVLRPTMASPAMSGIAKLRMQMEPLSLDTSSSRTSTMTRSGSNQNIFGIGAAGAGPRHNHLRRRDSVSPSGSRDGTQSDNGSSDDGSTSYEIDLRHDFVSESLTEKSSTIAAMMTGPIEGGLVVQNNRKMASTEFETLRCLGKGTYGTVLLVKQRTTGRLYAQKQFKKASLVVHKKLIEQTKTERQILESVNRHPFVVKLYYAFQDHEKLYLILEYGQGGELFTHLDTEKMFTESVAAFYMAEMLLAISHLHDNLGVVYRDLKPENCLLDSEGHLLLTDFGLSKVSAEPTDQCNSMLGTVEYMAPEVIQGKKYGKAVDWWSYGALGYDLMTGNPPFRGQNHAKIQENIVKQKLNLPYFLSADSKDLLTRLLRKEPTKRLGANMPKDLQTMQKHRFFRHINWKKLAAREMEPPIRPFITDPELAENFAPEFTTLAMSPVVTTSNLDGFSAGMSPRDNPFGGFSFVAPSSLLEREGFGMLKT